VTSTDPPRFDSTSTIKESPRLRCPECGASVQYILAKIGGAYSYQPCGHLGGTASK